MPVRVGDVFAAEAVVESLDGSACTIILSICGCQKRVASDAYKVDEIDAIVPIRRELKQGDPVVVRSTDGGPPLRGTFVASYKTRAWIDLDPKGGDRSRLQHIVDLAEVVPA